ncbi:HPr family phosphocarrier protein [Jiella mangrovi]|uniref:HPr family phosphocarrier protein n=1 Tax=Jiella mangrovi TaxID=2821407 RepID=A0ABS4BFL9_9HYPH|nr:HPr family phosphocarrier protein [Jiella mangrovi]
MRSRAEPSAASLDGSSDADAANSRIFAIVNKRGLHARASARFVETVENFDAEVTITREGMSVGGLSIMGLLMLAASQGTTIEVSAIGPEAVAVLDALEELIANRFGEDG